MRLVGTSEADLHRGLCDFVRLKYPGLLFNVDLSGMNLSKAQAGMAKSLRSSRAYPDFVLYEPRNGYHGLFIELKKVGTTIYKKNGELVANKHIREQAEMLEQLRQRGYYADFAVGITEAMAIVETYLKT